MNDDLARPIAFLLLSLMGLMMLALVLIGAAPQAPAAECYVAEFLKASPVVNRQGDRAEVDSFFHGLPPIKIRLGEPLPEFSFDSSTVLICPLYDADLVPLLQPEQP